MSNTPNTLWRPTRSHSDKPAPSLTVKKGWLETMAAKTEDAKTVFDILSDSPGAAEAWLPKRNYDGPNPNDYRELIGALPAATISAANSVVLLDVAFGRGKWRQIFTHNFEDHPDWARAKLASALLSRKAILAPLLS